MFEADLKRRLERIFDFKKTTFDMPGESLEQECLFINVESARCDIDDKIQKARVSGQAFVYANSDKMPYGFFAKRIAAANAELTTNFFFHEIDLNAPVMGNIVRRSLRFVFFYQSQYDPNLGIINQVTIIEGEP